MMSDWQPIETAIESAKANGGWIARCLLAVKREWGWECWVGQCDDGDCWLGRDDRGSCFEAGRPTHWQPLPELPTA